MTHVQAGVLLLHWIYLQPPIVRVLKPNADPGVAAVRIVAHRQQGHLVRGLAHPHHLRGEVGKVVALITLNCIARVEDVPHLY